MSSTTSAFMFEFEDKYQLRKSECRHGLRVSAVFSAAITSALLCPFLMSSRNNSVAQEEENWESEMTHYFIRQWDSWFLTQAAQTATVLAPMVTGGHRKSEI